MADVIRALAFILGFGAVFVGCIVLEAWFCRRQGRSDIYDFKETVANMVTGASYKIVDGIAITVLITVCYDYIAQYGLQWQPELSVWTVLLTFIAADFFMYFNHLAQHKIRWFWVVHVTHHSSTRMNLSTALRQNFINGLNGNWIFMWVPMALIGFDRDWTLIAIEANLVYQFFQHSELFGKAGSWYGKIFNTPSHHRVHHGCNPDQIDRNFGGVLIIWDKLFGTFQAEESAGEIVYGVPRMPEKPYNPWHMQVYEFVALCKDLWRYRDPRILFMPPEWISQRYPEEEASSTTAQITAEKLR